MAQFIEHADFEYPLREYEPIPGVSITLHRSYIQSLGGEIVWQMNAPKPLKEKQRRAREEAEKKCRDVSLENAIALVGPKRFEANFMQSVFKHRLRGSCKSREKGYCEINRKRDSYFMIATFYGPDDYIERVRHYLEYVVSDRVLLESNPNYNKERHLRYLQHEACSQCLMYGHSEEQCKNCFYCSEPGHTKKTCPKKLVA
ncbi:hypothetical protein B4U80_14117 [Leptotrombidium deliense]|uniref:CCHC-type domain-containing protein n=1 Tax=Leptotrombidium deliense TaxID=299467 RepID=A0A443S2E4_9ACAR|nr:hypothetical protein B4U80_14117 [Leptotrombidium deliense]